MYVSEANTVIIKKERKTEEERAYLTAAEVNLRSSRCIVQLELASLEISGNELALRQMAWER